MQYFERGKKEFVKRLTHTCICVMMHRYSCSKLQLHWYVCIASALVYPLSLPTAQCSPASAQTADMQPMWTCNCFARAIQSALLHSVYFWFLGCLQLLPVHRYVQLRGNQKDFNFQLQHRLSKFEAPVVVNLKHIFEFLGFIPLVF